MSTIVNLVQGSEQWLAHRKANPETHPTEHGRVVYVGIWHEDGTAPCPWEFSRDEELSHHETEAQAIQAALAAQERAHQKRLARRRARALERKRNDH